MPVFLLLSSPAVEALANEKTQEVARGPADAKSSDVGETCRSRLQDLEDLVRIEGDTRPVLPRPELRTLREAALVFARAEAPGGCEDVAQEMQNLLVDKRQERRRELERQRVAAAKPVTEAMATVSVDRLLGNEVVNEALSDLGTIEDIVIGPDEARYVLIEHGGFFGIGTERTPVKLRRLRVTEDGRTFVLPMSEEQLEKAPILAAADVQSANWAAIEMWWEKNEGR